MDKGQRVTALIGAGAVLDFHLPEGAIVPTTANITNAVVNKDYLDFSVGPRVRPIPKTDIVKVVYEKLKDGFGQDAWKVNFESIFHALESLYSYLFYWESNHKNINMMPVDAPLLFPIPNYKSNQVSQVMRSYLICIMDIVDSYNKVFKSGNTDSEWYRRFWSDYNNWDVFNLNYDSTIEDSLGDYTDGYEDIPKYDFKRFVPQKLIQESVTKSVVCHPHGCIMFGSSRYKGNDINNDVMKYGFHDLYKYDTYDEIRKQMIASTRSNAHAQDGETIWDSPIITGLRKTDKLNVFPFDYFNYYFNRVIQKNSGLLIVGYSFGDTYINEWLEHMIMFHGRDKCRVVLIDYWKVRLPGKGNNKEEWAYIRRDGIRAYNWEYKFSRPLTEFLCRITGKYENEQWIDDLCIEDIKGPMYSSNGCLMLFTDGFKDAAENHKEEIYTFLNS